MSNKDLSGKPSDTKIYINGKVVDNKAAWWYEDTRGIAIYYDPPVAQIPPIIIPWAQIRAALKRKDKK